MTRGRLYRVGIVVALAGAAATGAAVYASSDSPKDPVIVIRASDGKLLSVGDVVGQLDSSTDKTGVKSCISTRVGTEVSVEAPRDDNTVVEVSVDTETCRVVVTYIGPPKSDETLPGGREVESTGGGDK